MKRALTILILVGCAPGALAQSGSGIALKPIDRRDLCVTNGTVTAPSPGWLAIDTPSARAVVRGEFDRAAHQVAEIRFRYLEPTRETKLLASGGLRRQIGLKLRAEDTCNLIYAMWHIAPQPKIAVSVKRNIGMHTHAQCGVRGYLNFAPQSRLDLPPMRPGEAHTLRAELHGNHLTVSADGKVAWAGSLGREASALSGPPGLRTDNARFQFQYYAPLSTGGAAQAGHAAVGCFTSDGD